MKYLTLLFVSILFNASCNSDDNNPDISQENEKLILKKVLAEPIEANYNKEGRLESQKYNGEDFLTVSYNEDGLMHIYKRVDNIKITYEFFYNENKLVSLKIDFGNQLGQEETQKFNLDYLDNTITLKKIGGQNSEFISVHTFEDVNFNKLTSYKIINTNSDNIVFEETYTYDKNDNVVMNSFPFGGDDINNRVYNMSYDDKINPYSDGQSIDYLNRIFIQNTFGFPNKSSLMPRFSVLFSKNNLLTSTVDDAITITEIKYNDKAYPLKTEDVNEKGEVMYTRLYEYY